MARCARCGRGGLFHKMNVHGLCDNCELARAKEESVERERKAQEEAKRRQKEAAPFKPDFNYYTGELLAYAYDDVQIYVPDECKYVAGHTRRKSELELKLEPTNQYDPGAVAVYEKQNKLGYLYRGKMQDMARDFIKKHDTIHAVMGDNASDKPKIGLYFYLPMDEFIMRVKRKYPCYEFTLIANANEEMQSALGCTSEGEFVEFSYDYDKEKQSVSTQFFEIGYLPASANKINFDNCPFGLVIENIERESGKLTAKVMVIEGFLPGTL